MAHPLVLAARKRVLRKGWQLHLFIFALFVVASYLPKHWAVCCGGVANLLWLFEVDE